MESSNSISIEEVKIKCPNLTDELIKEALDAFTQFDAEENGYLDDVDVIVAMFLCLGCDVESEKFHELYDKVFHKKVPEEGPIVNREEFLLIMDSFVNEQDPVDGVISTL